MSDDLISEIEVAVDPGDDKRTEGEPTPGLGWPGADTPPAAGGSGADDGSGAITGGLNLDLPGYLPTPSAADMNASNASNAAAREQAIKDGMDEGTASILYPDFTNPEDMLKIN